MKKKIENNIEALRGFAALMVVIFHLIILSASFNGGYNFLNDIIHYHPSGHLMVLVFFMLSGYVIGLNYTDASSFSTSSYLKKRFLRLYPIYLFAILISALFFLESQKVLITTLFFGQNLLSDNLIFNGALWSLNHEVLYYLFAIPLVKYRINPVIVLASVIGLLTVSLMKLGFPSIIEGYLVGFSFWMTGFLISRIKFKQEINTQCSSNQLIALFFILLACNFLNPIEKLISKISFIHGVSVYSFDQKVSINDLAVYPFCLYAILVASSVKLKITKALSWFVYLLCWSALLFQVAKGTFFTTDLFYLPVIFLCISTIFIFLSKPVFKSISWLVFAGSLSYGVYAIHMPIIFLLGRIEIINGTASSFFVKSGIAVITILVLSYFLEKKMQPRIRQFFVSKNRVAILKRDKYFFLGQNSRSKQ